MALTAPRAVEPDGGPPGWGPSRARRGAPRGAAGGCARGPLTGGVNDPVMGEGIKEEEIKEPTSDLNGQMGQRSLRVKAGEAAAALMQYRLP